MSDDISLWRKIKNIDVILAELFNKATIEAGTDSFNANSDVQMVDHRSDSGRGKYIVTLKR